MPAVIVDTRKVRPAGDQNTDLLHFIGIVHNRFSVKEYFCDGRETLEHLFFLFLCNVVEYGKLTQTKILLRFFLQPEKKCLPFFLLYSIIVAIATEFEPENVL